MDLVDLYKTRGINKIPLAQWLDILRNYPGIEPSNKGTYIKNAGPSVIILSDNSIVSCVLNYYQYRDEEKNSRQSRSLSNKCYLVKQHFGLPVTNQRDCVECHKMCVNKRNSGELRRSTS